MWKPAILGVNFLTKYKAHINFLQETIQIGHLTIQMDRQWINNMKSNIKQTEKTLTLSKTITLQPKTETALPIATLNNNHVLQTTLQLKGNYNTPYRK